MFIQVTLSYRVQRLILHQIAKSNAIIVAKIARSDYPSQWFALLLCEPGST